MHDLDIILQRQDYEKLRDQMSSIRFAKQLPDFVGNLFSYIPQYLIQGFNKLFENTP